MSDEARLQHLVDLVLKMADGDTSARVDPSDEGDMVDAVTVGINLLAESLELERQRRERAEALLGDAMIAYDDAPAMLCSVEPGTYAIVKCNDALASALKTTKEHLLDRRLLGYFPVHERADAQAALAAIQEGRALERTSFQLVSSEGEVPVLLSGKIAEPKSGRLSLILRDVSVEAALEERLRRAEKLDLMGRLGSGVAHDFNNVLSVIKAGASLLEMSLPDPAIVTDILHAVDAGAALTRQLLDLARPPSEEPMTCIDLNGLVRDSERMLSLSLRECRLVVDLWSEPLPILAHPRQLSRVLLNLAINGQQAMSHGGLLQVCTREEDRHAVLCVQDEGTGMAPEVLDRVGEPFFTTKTEGSGLGLAGCMGIVQHSGGELLLASEEGRGTVVRVVFPLAH